MNFKKVYPQNLCNYFFSNYLPTVKLLMAKLAKLQFDIFILKKVNKNILRSINFPGKNIFQLIIS